MAHKVALINMKGGVGKSTLAVNVAWEMATAPWHKNDSLVKSLCRPNKYKRTHARVQFQSLFRILAQHTVVLKCMVGEG